MGCPRHSSAPESPEHRREMKPQRVVGPTQPFVRGERHPKPCEPEATQEDLPGGVCRQRGSHPCNQTHTAAVPAHRLRAPSHSLQQVGELSVPGFSMRPPPLRTQCGRLGDLFWDLLPTGLHPPCLQPNCPAFHRSRLPADPPGHCPCRPAGSGPTAALPYPVPHLVSCHLPYTVTGPLDLLSPGPETLALVLPCHPP